jgi:hypothetical protein
MRTLLDIAFGLIGLTGALLGPPLFAMTFWQIVAKRGQAWVAHVLFAPCVLAADWLFSRMIFFAAHDDGSGPPGLGLVLVIPFIMLIGSITFYYLALAIQLMTLGWRRISGS